MQRVLVSGIAGAGKTTTARRIAAALDLPRYELDALHHGPGWVKRPEFEDDVARLAATERWVTEDQYHSFLGDQLWERADTVVWLDLPRWLIMWQVVTRTAARMATRRELWNGNREQVRALLDPGHPIRWAWTRHAARRARTAAWAASHPDVDVVRIGTRGALRAWLETLDAADA